MAKQEIKKQHLLDSCLQREESLENLEILVLSASTVAFISCRLQLMKTTVLVEKFLGF